MPIQHRIALNSWTLESTPLRGLLAVAREAGYSAIELRTTDFNKVPQENDDVPAVRSSGLAIASLGAEATMVRPTAGDQDAWFRGLEKTVALALSIDCGTIMASTGMGNAATVAQAAEVLRTASGIVDEFGLRLAFEFNAFHPTIASLDSALDLLALAGAANAGLALDSYHLHRSDSMHLLQKVPPEKVFCVQTSDVPSSGSLAAAPLDRQIPGTGAVAWTQLFSFLQDIRYGGFVSFEAPNPAQWQRDPVAVATEGLSNIRRLWEGSAERLAPLHKA